METHATKLPEHAVSSWKYVFASCEKAAKMAWRQNLRGQKVHTAKVRLFKELPSIEVTWVCNEFTQRDNGTAPFFLDGVYFRRVSATPDIRINYRHSPLERTNELMRLTATDQKRLVMSLAAVLVHEAVHYLQDMLGTLGSYVAKRSVLSLQERKACDRIGADPDPEFKQLRKTNAKFRIYFSNRDEIEANAIKYAYAHSVCPKPKLDYLIRVELMHFNLDDSLLRVLLPHLEEVVRSQGLSLPPVTRR